MENKEKVEFLWHKFEAYTRIAEQHEFVRLFMCDSKLSPLYHDLQVNYTEEHAEIFIRVMNKVLTGFGVDVSSVE